MHLFQILKLKSLNRVCHLTGQYVRTLQKNNAEITDTDVLCLEMAALCYSLGMYC